MASSRSGSGKRPARRKPSKPRGAFVFPKGRALALPDCCRNELKTLIVPVVQDEQVPAALRGRKVIISVGDMVTDTLQRLGICPKVAVVDMKTKRGQLQAEHRRRMSCVCETAVNVRNPPAQITRELWDALGAALRGRRSVRIEVDGEEDLAAVAALYLAPDGAAVIYGIPDRGVEIVPAGAKMRRWARNMLARMTVV